MSLRPVTILSIIFFSFFQLQTVVSQSFGEWISKGNALYDEGNYKESGEAFDKAFSLEKGTASQYYNAACSWALTGDTTRSMEYLMMSMEEGWMNVNHLQRDSDLDNLHSVSGWEDVIAKAQANKDEYEKDLNKPLKNKLEQIYLADQTLRQLYREAEEKFGRESEEMQYFWSLVAEKDSINEAQVTKIIDEYGWVGKSEVGGKANMTLWLVVQHAPLDVQEKYLPLLKASVMKGESSGSHLALLEDRILMRNGKPQIYGSQITADPDTGESMVYDVFEPEYVNQRRKEVGLGPIEDYVKRFGLEWTIEQKEK